MIQQRNSLINIMKLDTRTCMSKRNITIWLKFDENLCSLIWPTLDQHKSLLATIYCKQWQLVTQTLVEPFIPSGAFWCHIELSKFGSSQIWTPNTNVPQVRTTTTTTTIEVASRSAMNLCEGGRCKRGSGLTSEAGHNSGRAPSWLVGVLWPAVQHSCHRKLADHCSTSKHKLTSRRAAERAGKSRA